MCVSGDLLDDPSDRYYSIYEKICETVVDSGIHKSIWLVSEVGCVDGVGFVGTYGQGDFPSARLQVLFILFLK